MTARLRKKQRLQSLHQWLLQSLRQWLLQSLRQWLVPAFILAAPPVFALAAHQPAAALPAGIAIISPAGATTTLGIAQIQALPAITITAAFGTAHGPFKAVFTGPLLWTVLTATRAVDAEHPKLAVRQSALITGSDGYAAVLALGEIAPAFEDKKIILATRMNGQYLGPQHLRIVVPGDKMGGRSVRDVVRIAVSTLGAPKLP